MPLAHRDPAQVHARSPTSPATPFAKRNRLTNSDREAMDDGTVVAPRNLVGRSSGMEVQDDKRQMLGEMRRHGDGIDVRPDFIGGQFHSCVASGKLYCEYDMAILASVLKGHHQGLQPRTGNSLLRSIWSHCRRFI